MRITKAVLGVISITVGLVVFVVGVALCFTIIGIPLGLPLAAAGTVFGGGGLALVTDQPLRSPEHYIRKAATQMHRPI